MAEDRTWLVEVTDYTGLRGESTQVVAATQEEAVKAALETTPGVLTLVPSIADITDLTVEETKQVTEQMIAATYTLADEGGLTATTDLGAAVAKAIEEQAAAHPIAVFTPPEQ